MSRISKTEYKENFVFKGGFLLSNIVGIKQRTTIDIDMLMKGYQLDGNSLQMIFDSIFKAADGALNFNVERIETIKKEDKYGGFRIIVQCRLENIQVNIPLDIATGDPVTPEPVSYEYIPTFGDDSINIYSYNVETMMAEKLETIYSRALANSRSKDFYDVFMIYNLHADLLELNKVRAACKHTFRYRNTELDYQKMLVLLEKLKLDVEQERRWRNFTKKNVYAQDISFETVFDNCLAFVDRLMDDSHTENDN
ncbi:MAG: nucleotidyl transferase AbiEii/AbiGii toxin family protein [Bacillota bacterium]|nr:nucleotidyl transferase AbiEii/AbiGii toxin family protein [Bacillota bacterium]